MSKKQKSLHVDDPVAVGSRIRAAREQSGLSQAALAASDCSAAYISRVELGDRTPSLQLLRELAKRLDVSAEFLAAGSVVEGGTRSRLLEAELALRLDDLSEARRLYEDVLAEASGRNRIDAMTGLGQLAHREGRHRDAIAQIEEAIDEGDLDPVDHPSIAETLARAYAEVGEPAQAIAVLTRCVERFGAGDDTLLYIRFAAMLGYALTDSGDLGAAERVVAQALLAGRDVADPYARARLYWSQSRLLAEQGNPGAAERYARKTLETLRVTEDTYAIAHALETLAHIYLDLGRASEALELLNEGEPLIELSGTSPEIGHFRIERARALALLGEKEEAAALAMSIAGLLAEVQPASRGRAYALLAGLYRELGDLERAKELYELALECAEGQAPTKHLSSTYRAMAEVLKELGRREEAFELLERALEVKERIGYVA
jgi:tetratricopeptide (TPR) repeat protein